ncbi:MAG: response regulator [Candidatus Sericytochromatia bacterium]
MQKKTILVVEDELMIAEDILESLSEMGYDVPCTVASGREAVSKTVELKPDLVLMDIMLKGEWDGIQTAHEIHKVHDCAIIYLTAYTDQKMLQRAKITSPFGYILKPFREKELHAMVEISLHRHEMEQQNREKQQLFLQTLLSTQDAIIVTDRQGLVQFINPAAEKLTGLGARDAQEKQLGELLKWRNAAGDATLEDLLVPCSNRKIRIETSQGMPLEVLLSVISFQDSRQSGYVLNLYTHLREAAPAPSGQQELISICASCKNVRNPQGNYISLEHYFRDRFQVRFSHGICPCCFETLYPEYIKENPL